MPIAASASLLLALAGCTREQAELAPANNTVEAVAPGAGVGVPAANIADDGGGNTGR